jgi:endonuclease YncB( thermonuclease family)
MPTLLRSVWVMSLVLCGICSLPASSLELVGSGTVIDGDTFDLCANGSCKAIRLCGVNAEEHDSRATQALANVLRDQEIRCVQVGGGTVCDGRSRPTNRGRIVAQCFVGATDIVDPLIRAGVVCDWSKFSGGHYSRLYGARTCQR